jgi:two-component sensor histidine kinase
LAQVPPSSTATGGVGDVLGLIALAFAYFLLAKLGLAVASLHPSASPIWPPSGLALAAFLLWGNRVWPAIGAGAFFANATTFGSISTSLAIAVGNTLEGAVAAWLVHKWCTRTGPFESPARVAIFAALTLAPGTMISATVGVGSLVLAGYANSVTFIDIWLTWWLGDVGGQLVVAPVIVLWATSNLRELGRKEFRRLGRLLAVTVAVGLVAFSPLMEQTAMRGAIAFLAIVPMLWAALRYNQRDTATAAFVLSFFAIWGALANDGPFARPSLNDSFLLVLVFVISTAVPSLVLSADVAVRKNAEARQALLVRELQHRTKNLLAVMQSIVNNTLARSRDPASARDIIGGRLQALARAQDFVVSGAGEGVAIRTVVAAELAPFLSRLTIDGAPVVVGNTFGQKLALVLHELATNAAKYGSLSKPNGRVLVSWKVDQPEGGGEPRLQFSWAERGGPSVKPPVEEGFGMQLISALLKGASRVSFEQGGLEFEVDVPLSQAMKDSNSEWHQSTTSGGGVAKDPT